MEEWEVRRLKRDLEDLQADNQRDYFLGKKDVIAYYHTDQKLEEMKRKVRNL